MDDGLVDMATLIRPVRRYLAELSRNYGDGQFQPLYDLIEREDRRTLYENIWCFRHKKCLNRRDIVYSLLAISDSETAVEVVYNSTLDELAFAILRSQERDFCLCYGKLVFQVLEYDEDAPRLPRHTLITVHLQRPLKEKFYSICSICQDRHPSIITTEYGPSCETRVYCLGCVHQGSRLRTIDGRRRLNHGHLIFVRQLNNAEQSSWDVFWTGEPTRDLSTLSLNQFGLLPGVKVLEMDKDGSTVLQTSSESFARLASMPFKAEFRSFRNVHSRSSSTRESTIAGYLGPKWRLLA